MKADLQRSTFDKKSWTEAGFYIKELGGNGRRDFMVVLIEGLSEGAVGALDKLM